MSGREESCWSAFDYGKQTEYENKMEEGVDLVCLTARYEQALATYHQASDVQQLENTSNPILVGAEGKRYNDSGLNWKPEYKLEHYFEKDLEDRIEDIKFNVQMFKSFIK